jgi:tetratricopeptide (TPR) repeat protein/O-antigen ligase
MVATTATAVNWRLSVWGSYERGQGGVTLLTYLLLFVLAANQLRPFTRARQVVVGMVAAAAPLIVFALAQGAGWRPFGLVSDARSPLFATLGRANFLGAYLAILTPLTLALLLTTRQRRKRVVWGVLLAGEAVVVGLTLARGAWAATAVSLSLFALVWWGGRLRRGWRALAWGGVGLLFVSGPLAVLWLGRQQRGSSAARLTIWQSVVDLIGQRPLSGYGADALGITFPSVYPPQLVYYQGRDFFIDRAHNLFLDWGVTAGLPGMFAFSLLLALFVLLMGRALRQPLPPQKRALLAAVLAAVAGNVANNLVSFEVTATATAVWLLMGVGVALAVPLPQQAVVAAGRRPFIQWALVGLLFVGVGTAVWQGNGRPLLADVAARSARRQSQAGAWQEGVAAAERAVAYWPVEPAHQLLLSQMYWRQAEVNSAEAALLAARQLRPEDPILWLRTAEFYTAVAQSAKANAAYQQAITLSPSHAALYTAWGRALLADDDAETAVTLLRRAVALDASDGQAYIYLGAAELAVGRVEAALADYREAVRLLPRSSQAYTGLARSYWLLGRPKEALQAAEQALRRDSRNAEAAALRQQIIEDSRITYHASRLNHINSAENPQRKGKQ